MKALDLCCGGGGSGMGLSLAGFEVTGCDIAEQPKYPFKFIRAHWLVMIQNIKQFDFVWASPVCKRYSSATRTAGTQENHPDDIFLMREKLSKWGGPWVIENVAGAPLKNAGMLCGQCLGCKFIAIGFLKHLFTLSIQNMKSIGSKLRKWGDL